MSIGDKIALAGLVVGVVSAIAAIFAAVYAAKAPTQEDLKRVEGHTADSAARLQDLHSHMASMNRLLDEQHRQEVLIAKAQRVHIGVAGDCVVGQPLEMRLILRGEEAVLTHVELLNESGNQFGSIECKRADPLVFSAVIDTPTVERWYTSADPRTGSPRTLAVRVYMEFDGREVFRNMAVTLCQAQRSRQYNVFETIYRVEGSV